LELVRFNNRLHRVISAQLVLATALALAVGPGSIGNGASAEATGWCRRPYCVKIARSPGRPMAKIRVRMHPTWVSQREYPKIIVKNIGETTIGTGYDYDVQRWVDGRWTPVSSYQAFVLSLRLLPPGERTAHKVWVESENGHRKSWQPGRYRIVKGVDMGTRPKREVEAKVVFRVSRA
jgi:hypothetical protein